MQMRSAQHANDTTKWRQSGWGRQQPSVESWWGIRASSGGGRTTGGEAAARAGGPVCPASRSGIRAGRPAVRLELMGRRWWWSTKAALCLAPMCSHPSEGSPHGRRSGQGEKAKPLVRFLHSSARREQQGVQRANPIRPSGFGGEWRLDHPISSVPKGSAPHSWALMWSPGYLHRQTHKYIHRLGFLETQTHRSP